LFEVYRRSPRLSREGCGILSVALLKWSGGSSPGCITGAFPLDFCKGTSGAKKKGVITTAPGSPPEYRREITPIMIYSA
jgi:hypothetical protein